MRAWSIAPLVLAGCLLKEEPPPVTDVHIDPDWIELTTTNATESEVLRANVVNVGLGDAELVEVLVFGIHTGWVAMTLEGELPVVLPPGEAFELTFALAEVPPEPEPWYEELEIVATATGPGGTGLAEAVLAVGELAPCDVDGDGFLSQALCGGDDCDDTIADIRPNQPDYCNGIDDDCDGVVDGAGAIDATVWYADDDRDGFGDWEDTITDCEAPEGYIDWTDPDCDDADPDTNPLAREICNERDDDCDGFVDDGALGETEWHPDEDGDGYGSTVAFWYGCKPLGGWVADQSDCDDWNERVHPGVPEDCDGIDQDCDGLVDDGASGGPTWYEDADRDGYGTASSTTVSCEQPRGYTDVVGDCDDADANKNPLRPEICNAEDDDCDGVIDEGASGGATWWADRDGDAYGDPLAPTVSCAAPAGHVSNPDDCDDGNAAISPLGAEACNGVDDDCDRFVDEAGAIGESAWYSDRDADAYGDPAVTQLACAQPPAFVADATDCDDAASWVHPGATEDCNSVDDDCDGVIDDGATGSRTWYADADGDTWGDIAVSTKLCPQPPGYVSNFRDCDDGDDTINPAAFEYCDDLDEDCDGAIDEEALDAPDWYGDRDGDGYGSDSTVVAACVAPSGYVDVPGDCDDLDGSVSPGEVEACDGLDQDCSGVIDDGAACPCDQAWEGDSAYLICDSVVDWAAADASCALVGYRLVTIEDSAEDLWLDALVDSYSTTVGWWIGFNDRAFEGFYQWSSGSSSAYRNWEPGQPDDAGNQDCVELNNAATGEWNDAACADTQYFVCEAG